MASVVSLTETKIQELLIGWEGVSLSQDQINALLVTLGVDQSSLNADSDYFHNVTLPQLLADLQENGLVISNLNDNILPELEATLADNAASIEDMMTVTIPNIALDLANNIENTLVSPKVYVQPEAPTNPDDDDRDLVVGDVWFDDDDGNKQRLWNGVEWSTFNVDVADFSLTVKKFLSTKHQIY